MNFSPSKSPKVLKNPFWTILSLYTADHFSTQNGLILAYMFILPQITRFGMDFNRSKSPKVLINWFWKIWSLYTLNYFTTKNGPISALMFIFPHITRFGMDFSPSKSPKYVKNLFWNILVTLHSWSLFDPKWPNFGLNVYFYSNNKVWYGF